MSDNTNIFSCMKESLQKRFKKIKKRHTGKVLSNKKSIQL